MTWGTGQWFCPSSYGKNTTSQASFLLPLLYWCSNPLFTSICSFYFLGTVLSSRPIPRVVGSCWKSVWARVWVWACQTSNSVLLCWRFFPLPCPYTQFVLFFGYLVKCRAGGRPRQWLSSAWAVDPKINWAWARATISLAPQKYTSPKKIITQQQKLPIIKFKKIKLNQLILPKKKNLAL